MSEKAAGACVRPHNDDKASERFAHKLQAEKLSVGATVGFPPHKGVASVTLHTH